MLCFMSASVQQFTPSRVEVQELIKSSLQPECWKFSCVNATEMRRGAETQAKVVYY